MNTEEGRIKANRVVGKHDALTHRIIGVFYDVHRELGHGFLESVYKEAMRLGLTQAGLQVECEFPVAVHFRDVCVGTFRADLIVNGVVLLELKAVDAILNCHEAQVLNYLRATPIEIGLLLNFGETAKIRRFVLDNERKPFMKESNLSALAVAGS